LQCIEADDLVSKFSTGSNSSSNSNSDVAVNDIDSIDNIFGDLIYMMYSQMKIGCALPYSNFFIDEIFSSYNAIEDSMSIDGILNLS
jgi:hypothetical protein